MTMQREGMRRGDPTGKEWIRRNPGGRPPRVEDYGLEATR